MNPLFEKRETVFSPCRKYRYRLRQIWNPALPLLTFLMLNPSKADEVQNDPTVERCERRARNTKECGGVEIINIFAYRATDPEDMKAQSDPIGPDNDKHILEAATNAYQVIAAWGKHGQHLHRGKQVLSMLVTNGIKPYHLKINKDGFPAHPLYISYETKPRLFEIGNEKSLNAIVKGNQP